jgi:RNA polymerase sigma factor (sigma-70 family)
VDSDGQQLERMFREHYDAVLAFALARADADTAKDVAARTFLVAWRRRSDWRELDSPRGWLLGVARRTLADQRRSAARYTTLQRRLGQYEMTAPPAPDPGDIVGDQQRVASAFGRLRPIDREVLALVAWDGLTPEEASRVMGCTRAAFAVRLHRARSRLTVQLQLIEGSEIRGSGSAGHQVSRSAPASLNEENP